MIFRQLFERDTSTYTYLIGDDQTRGAFIIDPVKSEVPKYLRLLKELNLELRYALDTHVHADHVTGLGDLQQATGCATVMGAESRAEPVSQKVSDGDTLKVGGLELKVIATPGHTDDSYSFLLGDMLFTGDTLFIRGTGRTDFQNGDAQAQYDSIFGKLLKLPEATKVYPGHDYNGQTVSTIGEEKQFNPRLQVASQSAYVEQMDSLNLPKPRHIDVAVPANLACGLSPKGGAA